MTLAEFSDQFSTLLNSYGSIGQFGDQASHQEIVLDEFEKSVFLTQAQDIIVKSYYERSMNPQGSGFDDSSRRQADFSSLITVARIPAPDGQTVGSAGYDTRGIVFSLPKDWTNNNFPVLLIINEKLCKMNGTAVEKEFVIKPISNVEYDRLMSKAYSKPLKKQAWRLYTNNSTGFDIQSEIIPRETTGSWQYRVRYIRRPKPIILEDLSNMGLSIDGISEASACELNPILHMDILLKAVELAAASRGARPAQQTRQEQ